MASIVIPVADQDLALTFYRDTLGLELRADFAPGAGFRWIEVAPPGSVTTMALALPRGGMWRTVGGDTNLSLACDDVTALHGRLRECGIDVDEHITEIPGGVPPMFRFRDPFGNILQVVQRDRRATARPTTGSAQPRSPS
ncbi:VOC family protein [Lapillicoccus sp.]|uniref:VOC family protein n=1 Tax=Lapillicoccus sp. TaxID=1909287 RepID=UPI0032660BD5